MKRIYVISFTMLSSMAAGNIMADCPGDRVSAPSSAVSGKMVSGTSGADSWQEVHCNTGANTGKLWDLKQGIGHPVDPSEFVGTWSVNTAGQLVHTYDDVNINYKYDLYLNSATNSYCLQGFDGAPELNITIADAPTDSCQ